MDVSVTNNAPIEQVCREVVGFPQIRSVGERLMSNTANNEGSRECSY
jgi:hypothetical protein